MGTLPDEVKKDIKDGLISGLEAIAVEYLKKQAMAALAQAAPWLFARGIAWLTTPVIGFIADSFIGFLLKETVLGLSLAYIAWDIQYQAENAEDFIAKLKAILENPEKYTAQQRAEVEAGFDETMVKLIRLSLKRF